MDQVKTYPWPEKQSYDVFEVRSFTEGTKMEGRVEVDLVQVKPGKSSLVHKHERSDTLLIPLLGFGKALIGGREYDFKPSAGAIWFDGGVDHGIITGEGPLLFISIQVPGIKIRRPDGEIEIDLIPVGSTATEH